MVIPRLRGSLGPVLLARHVVPSLLSPLPLAHVVRSSSSSSNSSTSSSSAHVDPSRPRVERRLVRDFIHDSLYNPSLGYFSRSAEILSLRKPIDFGKVKGQAGMEKIVNLLYEKAGDAQVWHTPAELYKPWYGCALAKYIMSKHKESETLQIFEIGGGNGTLAMDIMNYIRERHPKVYERSNYSIIEISPKLVKRQEQSRAESGHSPDRLTIKNTSILQWNEAFTNPCFVIGTEVLDNLAHDKVIYDDEGKPWECYACEDSSGKMWEEYGRLSDKLLSKYLAAKANALKWPDLTLPPVTTSFFERLKEKYSLPHNHPKRGEFMPTNAFLMMEKITQLFPSHRAILADFSELPDTIVGKNGPVVQTRLDGRTVACSTYLLPKGGYDIFFPTDFEVMAKIQELNPVRQALVMTQRDFMKKYADLSKTRTKGGYNPMIDEYHNMKFLLTEPRLK